MTARRTPDRGGTPGDPEEFMIPPEAFAPSDQAASQPRAHAITAYAAGDIPVNQFLRPHSQRRTLRVKSNGSFT